MYITPTSTRRERDDIRGQRQDNIGKPRSFPGAFLGPVVNAGLSLSLTRAVVDVAVVPGNVGMARVAPGSSFTVRVTTVVRSVSQSFI